jgi:hypothetical protein
MEKYKYPITIRLSNNESLALIVGHPFRLELVSIQERYSEQDRAPKKQSSCEPK